MVLGVPIVVRMGKGMGQGSLECGAMAEANAEAQGVTDSRKEGARDETCVRSQRGEQPEFQRAAAGRALGEREPMHALRNGIQSVVT